MPIATVRPKTRLKQMHWEKIDDINQTFWRDIEHEPVSDKLVEKGILEEVEKVFAAKSSAIKLKKDVDRSGEREGALVPTKHKISYLTRDLAQQFGINLHMFASLEVEQLVMKVLHCDSEVLGNLSVLEFFTSDSLMEISDSMLRNFMPYSLDFTRLLREPNKDDHELERADRLYLRLCFDLRHYWKSRSRALLLTETYQREYQEMTKKLEMISEACESVRNSEGLRNVLAVIRSVGNFMNDTSKQALGFKLDTLQRLKFMKDDSNSMTFMHYIEKIIRNTFPEFGSFVDELNSLNFVHNISIEQVDHDCQEYEQTIVNVTNSMLKGNLSDPSTMHPEDRILEHIRLPLERARAKNSLLQTRLNKTLSGFYSLMEYFGENSDDNTSRNSFFDKFVSFIREFKKAHVENIQREEDQRAYEARKQMMEESLNIKRNRKKKREQDEKANMTTDENDGKNDNEDGNEDDKRDDDDDDEDSDIDDSSSTAVIDSLLERLKASAPTHSSAKDRKNANRRSKALSFYSTMSLEDMKEQEDMFVDAKEYESVSSLRRRMSERKPTLMSSKADDIMTRALAMLKQLREELEGKEEEREEKIEKIELDLLQETKEE